ncbi:MAG: hypothetical protein IKA71_04365, partial [Lentisphaeria bacterium]|nr:hypothetical protein [Lentisphaeria bacterium]
MAEYKDSTLYADDTSLTEIIVNGNTWTGEVVTSFSYPLAMGASSAVDITIDSPTFTKQQFNYDQPLITTGSSQTGITGSTFSNIKILVENIKPHTNGTTPASNANFNVVMSANGRTVIEDTLFYNNYAERARGTVRSSGYNTFTGTTFTNNYAGVYGGAIHQYSGGTINIENSYFYDNKSYTGGAISAQDVGPVFITESFFSGNSASTGGALEVGNYRGHFYVYGGTFTGNYATSNGGAANSTGELHIYASESGKRSLFSGNTSAAGLGGAICINAGYLYRYWDATNSKWAVSHSSNYATAAQAIAVTGSDGNTGSFTLISNLRVENADFIGNKASYGGAIYAASDANIINCTFSGNTAANSGGALFVASSAGGSVVRVENSEFRTKSDTIYVQAGGKLELAGNILLNASVNVADNADAITLDGVTVTFENTSAISVEDIQFAENTVNKFIFAGAANISFAGEDFTGVDMIVKKDAVSGNVAVSGILAQGNLIYDSGKALVDGDAFINNHGAFTIDVSDSGFALQMNAVYVSDAADFIADLNRAKANGVSLVKFGDALFGENDSAAIAVNEMYAVSAPYSMLNDSGKKVVLTGSGNSCFKVQSGKTLELDRIDLTGFGGAADNTAGAIINEGTLNISKSVFYGNIAGDGSDGCVANAAAIYNASTGKLTVNGSTFSGNTSDSDSSGVGGVVFNMGSTVTLNDCLFSGNTVLRSDTDNYYARGIIRNDGGGVININGGTFYKCNSINYGAIYNNKNAGQVYVSGYTAADGTVKKAVFDNNYNAFYFNGGTLAVDNAIIKNSTEHVALSVNCNGTSKDYDFAKNQTYRGNVHISNTVFNNNVKGSVVFDGSDVVIENSRFETEKDIITNKNRLNGTEVLNTGVVTFKGDLLFNANINGDGTNNVVDADISFENSKTLTLSGLTFSDTLSTITFAGSETVIMGKNNQTGTQDLSKVAITVSADVLNKAKGYVIADNIALGENQTITVGEKQYAVGQEFVIGDYVYSFANANNKLTLEKTVSTFDMVYVAPEGTEKIVVNGEEIALAGRKDVFTSVSDAKTHLNAGGTMVIAKTDSTGVVNNQKTVFVDSTFTANQTMTDGVFSGNVDITFERSSINKAYIIQNNSNTDGDVNLTLNGVVVNTSFSLTRASHGKTLCNNVNYTITDSLILGEGIYGGGSDATVSIGGTITMNLIGSTVACTEVENETDGVLGLVASRANKVTSGQAFINLTASTVSHLRNQQLSKADTGVYLTVTVKANELEKDDTHIGVFSGMDKLVIEANADLNFTVAADLSDTLLVVDAKDSDKIVATGVAKIGEYQILNGSNNSVLTVVDGNVVISEATISDGTVVDTNFINNTNSSLITGGEIKAVFVGTDLTSGNVDTEVQGGKFSKFFVGGALVKTGSAVMGTVAVTVSGGEFADRIYGAGYAYGTDAVTELRAENSVINISGGTVNDGVFGGAHARKNAHVLVDAVDINISGGTFKDIFGGGRAERNSVSTVTS